MITIDIFSGMSQLDLNKRGVQRFQPYVVKSDEPRVFVEQGVYDFETSDNNNSSFWLDKLTTIYDLKLNGIEIPAAIMKISGRKNLVTTSLAGQDNAVIEIIGFQYYEVQVAGLIIDELGHPEDKVQDLNDLFKLNESLEVQCEFLLKFEINHLVIENFDFSPVEGLDNAIPFEFSSYSDKPIELELKNGLLSML
jgi:hypothetical protein